MRVLTAGVPKSRAVAWALWAVFMALFWFITFVALTDAGVVPGGAGPGVPFFFVVTSGAFAASRWPRSPIGWALVVMMTLLAIAVGGQLYFTYIPVGAVGVHLAFLLTLATWQVVARLLAGRAFDFFSEWFDRTVASVPFAPLFGLYVGMAVLWLIAGLAPTLTATAPSVREVVLGLASDTSMPGFVTETARRILEAAKDVRLSAATPFGYVISVLNLALGLFVMRLRGSDWTARALAVGLVGTAAVFNQQAHAVLVVVPAFLYFHEAFHAISGVSYILALLLFPDGRIVVHWPRRPWIAWPMRILYGASVFAGVAFLTVFFHGEAAGFVIFFGVLVPLVGITAQALRYRHAKSATQRQQSRVLMWFLSFGFVAAILVGIAALVLAANEDLLSPALAQRLNEITFVIFPALFAVIPVSLIIVLFRYHLWDIDLLITRTLVYGATSATLAATFFLGILALTQVMRPLTAGSELAVAASTLLSFALFQPIRRRVQDAVDRRFARSRYDTARMLDGFAEQLRDEVDLDDLRADLLAAVSRAMAPAYSSLWLRDPALAPRPGTTVTISGRPAG
ncbi:MAG: hypothetical protein M3T56_18225 [Chloroflexota bacterium]|nr:hypothetical protein [Chloroflexota bacterium]